MTDGLLLPPGGGDTIQAMTLKAGAEQTAAWSVFEAVVAPAVVLTLLGLGIGLFDGWQIDEPGRARRLTRIAGHGLLGALVGVTVGGIAIVGAFLIVHAVRLLLGLLA